MSDMFLTVAPAAPALSLGQILVLGILALISFIPLFLVMYYFDQNGGGMDDVVAAALLSAFIGFLLYRYALPPLVEFGCTACQIF